MALFLNLAGLHMTNVSYRGSGPALNDVIAGHIPTMFSPLGDLQPHMESGTIRVLAVTGDHRSAYLRRCLPSVNWVSRPSRCLRGAVYWHLRQRRNQSSNALRQKWLVPSKIPNSPIN